MHTKEKKKEEPVVSDIRAYVDPAAPAAKHDADAKRKETK